MTFLTRDRHTERPRLNTAAHEELAGSRLRHSRLTAGALAALLGALLTWFFPIGLAVRLVVVAGLFLAGMFLPLLTADRARRWALDWIARHSGLAYESYLELSSRSGSQPPAAVQDDQDLAAVLEERAYLATRSLPQPSFTPYYLPILAVTALLLFLPQLNLGGLFPSGAGGSATPAGTPPSQEAAPAAPTEPEREPDTEESRIPFNPTESEPAQLPEENDAAQEGEEAAAEQFLQALREQRELESTGAAGTQDAADAEPGGAGPDDGAGEEAAAAEPGQAQAVDGREVEREEVSSASPESPEPRASGGQSQAQGQEGEQDGQESGGLQERPLVEREGQEGEPARRDSVTPAQDGESTEEGEEGGSDGAAPQGQDEPAPAGPDESGEAAQAGDQGEGQEDEPQEGEAPVPQQAQGEAGEEGEGTTTLQGSGDGQQGPEGDGQSGQAPSQDDGVAGNDDEASAGGAGAGAAQPQPPGLAAQGEGDIAFLPGRRGEGESSPGGEVRIPGSPDADLPLGRESGFYREEVERVIREGRIPLEYQEVIRNYFR